MEIRQAMPSDFDEIQRVYATARDFMRKTGNPNQWKTNHPDKRLTLWDFENNTGYIVEDDGKIIGVFAFILGKDPTYSYIKGGQWLNDEPYGTIHRIASDGTRHGLVSFVFDYCSKVIPNLRIDTHEDNKVMQHILEKNGFHRCGIIFLENGEERVAFQKKY